MSLGIAIVLEREISGVDPQSFDGRTLAAKRHALDAIAHELDLRGLGEFVAFSHAESEALAEDMKFDAPTVGDQTGRWFSSRDGLEVVRAVRDHLKENPEDIEETEAVVGELNALEKLLRVAEENEVRFRLSVDYG